VSADVRRAASSDIPALLPLVEPYWIYEDIAGFELLDKPLPAA
jgi:hypothetical protein